MHVPEEGQELARRGSAVDEVGFIGSKAVQGRQASSRSGSSRGLADVKFTGVYAQRVLASLAAELKEKGARRVQKAIHSVRPDLERKHRCKELLRSGQLSIGRYTYGLPEVIVYPGDTHRALIGSFCSIAEDVRIFVGGNHRTDWVSTYPFRIVFELPDRYNDGCPASKGDVVIGHDVWIGAGATVLSGVRVGNGAVIGASAVVAGDVPSYTIAVGNPATNVRRRFSDEHIAALEEVKWWDWPVERIVNNVEILCSPDISLLVSKSGSDDA